MTEYAYRGDTRGPDDETMQAGFTMRFPWTAKHAQQYVRLWLGYGLIELDRDVQNDIKRLGISICDQTWKDKPALNLRPPTPQDLMRGIIERKDKKRPTISTDLDSGCGGYANEGWVYKIDMRGMKKVDWPKMPLKPTAFWPALYINVDATELDVATTIAVLNKQGVQELSFLTTIDRALLVEQWTSKPKAEAVKAEPIVSLKSRLGAFQQPQTPVSTPSGASRPAPKKFVVPLPEPLSSPSVTPVQQGGSPKKLDASRFSNFKNG